MIDGVQTKDFIEMGLVAGAIWGAIRTDIRYMREDIKEAKSLADRAHRRLDDLAACANNSHRAKRD